MQPSQLEEAGPWSAHELLQALRLQLAMPDVQTMPTAPTAQRISQALLALPQAQLWPLIAALEGQAVAQWLMQQPDPFALVTRLGQGQVSRQAQATLQNSLTPLLPVELRDTGETLKQLTSLFQHSGAWQGATAVLERRLQAVLWEMTLQAGAAGTHLSAAQLLASVISTASLRLEISLEACAQGLPQQANWLHRSPWRDAWALIAERSSLVKPLSDLPGKIAHTQPDATLTQAAPAHSEFRQDPWGHYLDHAQFDAIARHLLQHGRLPESAHLGLRIDLTRLLLDLLTQQPHRAQALLKELHHQPEVKIRLLHLIPWSCWIDTLYATSPDRPLIELIQQFQQLLDKLDFSSHGPSRRARLGLLSEIVLSHWLAADWKALKPQLLIVQYLGQLMSRNPLRRSELQQRFAPHLTRQSATLRHILEEALCADHTDQDPTQPQVHKPVPSHCKQAHKAQQAKLAQALKDLHKPQIPSTPIAIPNSGLVLLQSFIPMLLSRLRMTDHEKFVSPQAQRRAVHLLQYLVTGHSATAEEHLALNKLLCGLALHEPVDSSIEMGSHEVQTCHSLLEAVINYWPAIADSSIAGLRGNWLVRSGTLCHAGDHWDLTVDKRVYDLLLGQAPFSYSVIKFPWMETAVYVRWPT